MFQVKALILQYLFYCVESHTIILVFVHKAVELGWGWGRQLYVGNTRIFLVCLFFFKAALVPFIFKLRGCSSDDSFCK